LNQVVLVQRFSKLILGGLVLFFLVQGVSAFTVSSINITPSGNVNPDDPVTVSYTVYAASGVAFPSYDDLQFITELDDPRWSYSISVNGIENIKPVVGGRILTISGFELAYRNQDEVIVKASLQGRVPLSSPLGTNKTLIKIQELDSRGNVIPLLCRKSRTFNQAAYSNTDTVIWQDIGCLKPVRGYYLPGQCHQRTYTTNGR
jgi:hypothetical protein